MFPLKPHVPYPAPKRCLTLLALVLCGLHTAPSLAAPGPGDLLVAPTRVLFAGRTRNAEITLVNLGETAATYRISFVELRMDERGGTREIEATEALPGENFASSMVRFSPRQVRLEPKVAQLVRLQLRPGPTSDAGGPAAREYRSHLLFRAIPESWLGGAEAESEAAATGVAVQLVPVYGVSVPVIVRQGEASATARLLDLELAAPDRPGDPPRLVFRIEREGNASLYGNLIATFTPRGGKSRILGEANGVAVYAPNPFRSVSLLLQVPPELREQAGTLHLTYQAPSREILAEARLELP